MAILSTLFWNLLLLRKHAEPFHDHLIRVIYKTDKQQQQQQQQQQSTSDNICQ